MSLWTMLLLETQQGYQQVRSRIQKRSRESIEFINIKAKWQNTEILTSNSFATLENNDTPSTDNNSNT